ncbi:MAG TPA: S24/S26 family peptidase [Candidatus Baltobacteraceae bacterium]|nr:S24/S26 family peptidase [Candidatus Baltobacteraceae bacterium]
MARPDSAEFLREVLQERGSEGAAGGLAVYGTSMLPSIADGDRIRPVPAEGAVRVGDVVLRRRESAPILHRLVGFWPGQSGWRLLIVGDGERVLDPSAAPGDILGNAVARIAHGTPEPLAPDRGRALRSLLAGLLWELLIKTRRAVTR